MPWNDDNAPQYAIVPIYGPDGQSKRMALWNAFWANPFSPASWGLGIRPAPSGASATERTKSTAALPPQQQFKGVTHSIVQPSKVNAARTSSFPSTSVGVNPTLMAFDVDPTGGWG